MSSRERACCCCWQGVFTHSECSTHSDSSKQIAVRFNLSLQAHLHWVSTEDAYALLELDTNGAHKKHGKKMRSFIIPKRFVNPDNHSEASRKINILAAFFGFQDTLLVIDFNRLMTMRVMPLSRVATATDLLPGSEVSCLQVCFDALAHFK